MQIFSLKGDLSIFIAMKLMNWPVISNQTCWCGTSADTLLRGTIWIYAYHMTTYNIRTDL